MRESVLQYKQDEFRLKCTVKCIVRSFGSLIFYLLKRSLCIGRSRYIYTTECNLLMISRNDRATAFKNDFILNTENDLLNF